MSSRFGDRVALVTGAASGIGLATAMRLGADGARVVLADLRPDAVRHASDQVRTAGAPDALAVECDVSREAQVIAAVARTLDDFGRLDFIVNNAGLMTVRPLEQLTEDDFRHVLEVDLMGAFFFIKQAFLHMQPGAAIVNVSSVHAVETTPGVAPYAAAKAALLSLTRSAALEGKSRGIRVNAILPGAVDTAMLWNNPNVRTGLEQIQRTQVGRPEDIAAVIAFLLSTEAAFIQGAALRVDGGRLSHL